MPLLLLPLVALAAALAYAAGGRRTAAVVGAAGLALVVVGGGLIGLVELRSGSDGDTDSAADDPAEAPAPLLDDEDAPAPPLRNPDIFLAVADDVFDDTRVIDGLSDGDLLLVEVSGDYRQVSLHQCPAGRVTATRCGPGVVAAGVDRAPGALFEFAEVVDTGSGALDCTEVECVLAVFDANQVAFDVPLLFGGQARPRPSVTLVPSGGLAAGQDVTVSVSGAPPGAAGIAQLCAAGEDEDRPRCATGDDIAVRADDAGRATATVRLANCGRLDRCALRVALAGAIPTFAELSYASPPGPDLDGSRVAAGLAVAVGLLLGAFVLLRRTEWTNPDGDPFAGIDLAHTDPFAGIDLSVDPDGDWL